MTFADYYAYRVIWSPEDDAHIGTVAEWPSLSWADETPTAALAGIQRLVNDALEDIVERGATPPQPLAEPRNLGR